MLISTFELLVKPQLPTDLPPVSDDLKQKLARLRRTAIQGYFLTIANLSAVDISLALTFTIKLPAGADLNSLLGFFDTTGTAMGDDMIVDLKPVPGFTNKFMAFVHLKAQDTGLLLVQPNIIDRSELLEQANFEVRGFAEVALPTIPAGVTDVAVLITPEHRGTFYSNLAGPGSAGRDQIAYALPVQNGGLFTFKSVA